MPREDISHAFAHTTGPHKTIQKTLPPTHLQSSSSRTAHPHAHAHPYPHYYDDHNNHHQNHHNDQNHHNGQNHHNHLDLELHQEQQKQHQQQQQQDLHQQPGQQDQRDQPQQQEYHQQQQDQENRHQQQQEHQQQQQQQDDTEWKYALHPSLEEKVLHQHQPQQDHHHHQQQQQQQQSHQHQQQQEEQDAEWKYSPHPNLEEDVPYHHDHHHHHHHQQQHQQHQQQQQQQQKKKKKRKKKKKMDEDRNNSNKDTSGGSKSSKGPLRINVNGRQFVLSRSTCIRIPVLQGMLTRMKQSTHIPQTLGVSVISRASRVSRDPSVQGSTSFNIPDELYFERNSTVFAAVVDYVQNNELHVPPHICPKLFARDLSFWGFDIDEMESCCFSGVVHFLWEQDRLSKFHGFLRPKTEFFGEETHEQATQLILPRQTRLGRFRQAMWKILDEPFTGKIAQAYFYIMCAFIMTSFFVIAMDTVEAFQHKTEDGAKGSSEWITILSHICAAYLYVDYLLRILFYPDLRRFLCNFINITDGLAVLSSIAKAVTESGLLTDSERTRFLEDAINSLQLLRILRLLRPMSKVIGFRLIYFTLKCSFHELLLVLMLLIFLTMIFSSLLYYLGDRGSIKSIPHAMWFSLTTMTTVGYGDIVPEKARTKVIGSVVAVFGVILMSMTMPIMVSNFNLLYINAVVGQPSAINKVHRGLEKADEVSNGASFRSDEPTPSQAKPEEPPKQATSYGGRLKAWFHSFRQKKKQTTTANTRLPTFPSQVFPHPTVIPPYPVFDKPSDPDNNTDGGGSDADAECSEGENNALLQVHQKRRHSSLGARPDQGPWQEGQVEPENKRRASMDSRVPEQEGTLHARRKVSMLSLQGVSSKPDSLARSTSQCSFHA